MRLEDELTSALIAGYRRAGEELGYWGTRFLQAVQRNGGLATAQRMLRPRSEGQRAGLDVLLEASRPDLTIEAIVISDRFSSLFTAEEISVARERLGDFGRRAAVAHASRERLYGPRGHVSTCDIVLAGHAGGGKHNTKGLLQHPPPTPPSIHSQVTHLSRILRLTPTSRQL